MPSYGLQLISNGLLPSDGLQPNSDGLKPNSEDSDSRKPYIMFLMETMVLTTGPLQVLCKL